MTFHLGTADLERINSATKYPSIPTFHPLNRDGNLEGKPATFVGKVMGEEKIDGTNARVLMLPDSSFLIGSRTELLFADGDLIKNPSQGIVPALHEAVVDIVAKLESWKDVPVDSMRAFYLEVYGGNIGQTAKNYTSDRGQTSFRLFDVADIPLSILDRPRDEIAIWREAGHQRFLGTNERDSWAESVGLELVPALFTVEAAELPMEIPDMLGWMGIMLPRTRAALDEGARGKAEGIILRAPGRQVIYKARFDDYEKTLRRLEKVRGSMVNGKVESR